MGPGWGASLQEIADPRRGSRVAKGGGAGGQVPALGTSRPRTPLYSPRGARLVLPVALACLAGALQCAGGAGDGAKEGEGGEEGGWGVGETLDVSFITAGRNDGHSGDFLRRLRTTVRSIENFRWEEHGVKAEIIIVCWNEGLNAATLSDVMFAAMVPGETTRTRIRFIAVPPELHDGFSNPEKRSFLQYNAKNVGMRRARGRVLVLLNGDTVMSLSLMHHIVDLAEAPDQRLEGRFMVASRYDLEVMCDREHEPLEMPYNNCDMDPEDRPVGPAEGGELALMAVAVPDMCERREYRDFIAETSFLTEQSVHNIGDFLVISKRDAMRSMGYLEHVSVAGMDGEYVCRLAHVNGLQPVKFTWPCVVLHQPHDVFYGESWSLTRWRDMCKGHRNGTRLATLEDDGPEWGLRGVALGEVVVHERFRTTVPVPARGGGRGGGAAGALEAP